MTPRSSLISRILLTFGVIVACAQVVQAQTNTCPAAGVVELDTLSPELKALVASTVPADPTAATTAYCSPCEPISKKRVCVGDMRELELKYFQGECRMCTVISSYLNTYLCPCT